MSRTMVVAIRARSLGLPLLGLLLCWGGPSLRAAPPVITNQPVSVSVSSGAFASFSVTAENPSPAPIFFQWRRNGVDIPGATNSKLGFSVSDVFSIQSVQPTNCGTYSVVAYNIDGAVSSAKASLLVTNLNNINFGDNFAVQGSISGNSGVGRGVNTAATKEFGEPDHGGKKGGASVWVHWTAPGTGIATFHTLGSGFDTTLAIYTGAGLAELVLQDQDDDTAGYANSAAMFNTVQGTTYLIAVDGYYGAKGNIILSWSLESTTDKLAQILDEPAGQTVGQGGQAKFFVTTTSGGPPILYQWLRNGAQINGANSTALTISNVQPADVGLYQVALRTDGSKTRTVLSRAVELQINNSPDGPQTNVVARRKFREAIDPGVGPELPNLHVGGPLPVALAAGFSGTQVFSTAGSFKEDGEPNHCNEAGGASYWLTYQAPASGTLTLNAAANFNDILAVYSLKGNAFTFDKLQPVACSDTNGAAGSEIVTYEVSPGLTNYIVVDGVAGATGTVALNYSLAAAPAITNQPASQSVAAGNNVTLTVGATGTPNLGYRWRSNAIFLGNRTNTSLSLTNFQTTFQAAYDVVVTNAVGGVTSTPAFLYLNTPLRFTNLQWHVDQTLTVLLIGQAQTNYVLQASTNLSTTNWLALATNNSPLGLISYTNNLLAGFSNRFFRARSQ